MNVSLYVWQRSTAAIMAPMVAIHLAVIFYAARHGFTAADIFSRTRGSVGWASFYALFVIAASIHGSIGVRTVLSEWSPLQSAGATRAAWVLAVALACLGLFAIAAMTLP